MECRNSTLLERGCRVRRERRAGLSQGDVRSLGDPPLGESSVKSPHAGDGWVSGLANGWRISPGLTDPNDSATGFLAAAAHPPLPSAWSGPNANMRRGPGE